MKVIYGTTEKRDGDWHISGLTQKRVADYIERHHGVRPRLVVWGKQIHGSRVLHVRSKSCIGDKADSFYTERPGIALTVRTADCVPVFVDGGTVIGLAHAGMAGAVKQIVPKLVRKISERHKIEPASIKVRIGSHICEKCYTISPNNDRWLQRYPETRPFRLKRGGQETFSLVRLLQSQLKEVGVQRVTVDRRCTHHDDLFSSRHGHTERHLSYMMLSE